MSGSEAFHVQLYVWPSGWLVLGDKCEANTFFFCSIIVQKKTPNTRQMKFLFCLNREVSSAQCCSFSFSFYFSSSQKYLHQGQEIKCVGWELERARCLARGPPGARVLAFIARGERFLLDVFRGCAATGGWLTSCRWQPQRILCKSTEEVAVGKLLHNCQCSLVCCMDPTLETHVVCLEMALKFCW